MIFAVTAVIVEILVGVIEQDAAGVLLHQPITFGFGLIAFGRLFITGCGLNGLTKSSELLKGKTVFAKLIALAHPIYAARATMAFIHQHQIVGFKCFTTTTASPAFP